MKKSIALLLPFLLIGCFAMCGTGEKTATILEQIDIAPVWSVHQAGPPELLTRDGRQYAGRSAFLPL
jgi:hypothetical protein